jgi:translation initiation factor SUI1
MNIVKRNARKCITIIEGLDEKDFDKGLKNLLKKMRKLFSCNGSMDKDKETEAIVLKLQGDQRENVKSYIMQKYNIMEEDIIIHGV